MAMLKRLNVQSQWWIKRDWIYVLKGLWESVSGEWAGDVDLNDGKLQQAHEQHKGRIKWIKSIILQSQGMECIKQNLMKAQDIISTEIGFVSNGMCIFII